MNLPCAGNKVFVKSQAQGGGFNPDPSPCVRPWSQIFSFWHRPRFVFFLHSHGSQLPDMFRPLLLHSDQTTIVATSPVVLR